MHNPLVKTLNSSKAKNTVISIMNCIVFSVGTLHPKMWKHTLSEDEDNRDSCLTLDSYIPSESNYMSNKINTE